MRLHTSFARGALLRASTIASLALVGACSTGDLLEVEDPDIIDAGQTQSAEGALGLANGGLDAFRNITAGNESTWLFGGLLADEWATSSTFPQNDETDQRRIQTNNGQVTSMLYRLYRARSRPSEAITALNKFNPTQRPVIAEMYLAKGFAEMQLALDFCNGIPLSDVVDGKLVEGAPLTNQQVFARASSDLDSAIAFANGTDAKSVQVARAARVVKARVLMAVGSNQYAAAAALVTAVPTSFTYQQGFSLTGGTNTIWGQGLSARRYVVGANPEGNSRNIVIQNALPFSSANDPRVPVTRSNSLGQDGLTAIRTTNIWGQLTSIDVVHGIDARMIEAEAALALNTPAGVTQWLAIHNALRAAPPKLGEVQPAALPPLTDPGTQAARVTLHFTEKAYWTFSRGQRLGDLRRLIRQYGRTQDQVFPVGIHFKGGNYGTDVNFPIVVDEENNSLFKGCLDRNA
ncbi:MAG: hypothetical protein JNJ98_19470 [Gemmatimonadetes bacterium]|nr:hypothetical protein [Gemmatimonadota bacterium]